MTTRARGRGYYDEEELPRSSGRRLTAREVSQLERKEARESNIAMYGTAIPNVEQKRAVEKQQREDHLTTVNKQLIDEGRKPLEMGGRKSTLRDLRQEARPSFAETDKANRDAATRSGAFGSGAQKRANVDDRKALYSDMQKGGDSTAMRQRATELGVDQKGWDIAQARIANKTRPQTAEEAATFGVDKSSRAGAPTSTATSTTNTAKGKGGVDLGGNRGAGEDTAMGLLDSFNAAAMDIGKAEFATDATKSRLAKEAEMKGLDAKIAANASAVEAATTKRRTDAATGENIGNEAERRRDAAVKDANSRGVVNASNRAEANKNMAAKQADIDKRSTLNPLLKTTKALAYASPLAPAVAAYDIASGLADKVEDRIAGNRQVVAEKTIARNATTDMARAGLADAQQKSNEIAGGNKTEFDKYMDSPQSKVDVANNDAKVLGDAEREKARQAANASATPATTSATPARNPESEKIKIAYEREKLRQSRG